MIDFVTSISGHRSMTCFLLCLEIEEKKNGGEKCYVPRNGTLSFTVGAYLPVMSNADHHTRCIPEKSGFYF
jgi:hypothetical protein